MNNGKEPNTDKPPNDPIWIVILIIGIIYLSVHTSIFLRTKYGQGVDSDFPIEDNPVSIQI